MLRTTSVALAALLLPAAPAAMAAPPPGQSHTTYDIVVNNAGNKVRGTAGTSAFSGGTGIYIAQFPTTTTTCSYVASLARGIRHGGVDERPGFVTVVRSSAFANGVFVQTFGPNGKRRNRPFHLIVAC